MYEIVKYLSPLGELLLALDPQGGLTHVVFGPDVDSRPTARVVHNQVTSSFGPSKAAARVIDTFERYFADPSTPLDVPLAIEGSDFQRTVWIALREIPVGETRTYSQLARAVGSPKAVRALGHANGRNPISIIVPCHRLVGSDGALRGYAGGLDRKRWLLDHEQRVVGAKSPKH